ncbi:MAG: hypothetical protein ABI051_16360 [Vicinamibacterales bacterium]
MPPRQTRNPVDLLESALQGARDDTNFPVRSDRAREDHDPGAPHTDGSVTLTPEERDSLSTVPGERRSI